MKKGDIFIGPGNGFEDLKSFVDRSLFIVENLHFLNGTTKRWGLGTFLNNHPLFPFKDMTLGFNLSMGYKERYILCHCMTFCSYWVQGLAIKMGQE